MTREQLIVAQAYEMQYQFLARTSVRDGKSTYESEELVFIVLDLPAADYLRSVFGVQKPSVKLNVPALSNYRKPARKTRSDEKPDDVKHAARMERQKQRRPEKRAAKHMNAADFAIAAG